MQNLNFITKYFHGTSFFADVSKLSLGTVLGRIIALLALPLITRIYTPEEFNLFAVYLGIVSTISIAACLRLEIAIPIAKNNRDASYLFILCILIVIFISAFIAIPSFVTPTKVVTLINQPKLEPYLWLIPAGVMVTGFFSALQYLATRKRLFNKLAFIRVYQAFISTIATIIIGLFTSGSIGLFIGSLLNNGSGSLLLGINASRKNNLSTKKISLKRLFYTLKKFKRYPIFSVPESLLNIAGLQIPIIIIASSSSVKAGFLFLAMQVMSAPMNLIGRAISQVFVSRARNEDDKGNLSEFTSQIIFRLTKIGAPILIIVGIVSPSLFKIIFGLEWQETGIIVTLLVPWMLFQFISSPVSMVMYAKDRQISMLSLTTFGFLIRIIFVCIAFYWYKQNIIESLIISSTIFYAVCLLVFSRAAGIQIGKKEIKFIGLLCLALILYSLIVFLLYGGMLIQ